MYAALRGITICLLFPVLAIGILSLPAYAKNPLLRVYHVTIGSAAGGPVRTGAPTQSLLIRSEKDLSGLQVDRVRWHYRNAERLAQVYAAQHGLSVQRTCLPSRLEICASPAGVANLTGQPRFEHGGEAVARVDLREGTVFLGRSTVEDLYVELGKWFFYEVGYAYGRNHGEDLKRMRNAENFARFCLDKRNWTEAGGTGERLW